MPSYNGRIHAAARSRLDHRMTGLQVLASRAAIGLVAGGASLAGLRVSRFYSGSARRFDRGLLLALAASRFALFALIFLVLHIPARGDVAVYYLPEARSVLHGLMPYRGFDSSYGPLHPYMDALVLRLWNSAPALILFSILIEIATLRLFLFLARTLFSDRRTRVAGLLYLANPLSLQFVTIDGHDNVLLALLLGLGLWSMLRSRNATSGFLIGIGVGLLKLIALFYAPVYWLAGPLAGRRRWIWSAGFVLALFLGEGIWFAMGLPLLTPIRIESAMKQAGDLPFLVESILGIDLPGRLLDAIMVLMLALVWAAVAIAARGRQGEGRARIMLFALPAITLVLELFAKKSWPPYLMIVLFPLCLLLAEQSRRALWLFEFFCVVCVFEHSFWATVLGSIGSGVMHQGLLQHAPNFGIYLVLQVLLLSGYAWLLRISLLAIRHEARPQSVNGTDTPTTTSLAI